jgi:lipopolysaccharide transport system permease protein
MEKRDVALAEHLAIGSVPVSDEPRHVRPVTVIRPPALTLPDAWRALRLLPRYADLLGALTVHRINVRYKQSALGPAWAIVQPLAMMLVFTVVFSTIAPVPTGGYPFPIFAYAGLLPWSALAAAVASGSTSLVTHSALVTRVYFPREILPMTYVASALFDLAIASSVLGVMLVFYRVALTAAIFWTIPVLLVLAALALAVSLALCAIHARFRDIGVAMPLLLQVWMFSSPVIYPLDAIPAAWRPLYTLNPMAGIVDGFRRAVLQGLPPDPAALGASAAIVAVGLPAAYLWFKHVDATLADIV